MQPGLRCASFELLFRTTLGAFPACAPDAPLLRAPCVDALPRRLPARHVGPLLPKRRNGQVVNGLLVDNRHRKSAVVASADVPREVHSERVHEVIWQQVPDASPCFCSEYGNLSGPGEVSCRDMESCTLAHHDFNARRCIQRGVAASVQHRTRDAAGDGPAHRPTPDGRLRDGQQIVLDQRYEAVAQTLSARSRGSKTSMLSGAPWRVEHVNADVLVPHENEVEDAHNRRV